MPEAQRSHLLVLRERGERLLLGGGTGTGGGDGAKMAALPPRLPGAPHNPNR